MKSIGKYKCPHKIESIVTVDDKDGKGKWFIFFHSEGIDYYLEHEIDKRWLMGILKSKTQMLLF
jgi:hypothetical protein